MVGRRSPWLKGFCNRAAIHDRNSRFTRKLEIEVTAYYDRQTRATLMNVRNNLS